MYYNFIGFNFGFVILVLLVFGILQWFHVPAGSFIDWVIALAIFEWLLVIVTVPWNVYFEAKEVIAEADRSVEKGITVNRQQVQYAQKVARISLVVALILHVLSAAGFYILAATGISAIGYISSGAALLLTILRPSVRAYEYIATQLAMIRQQIKYPREDVLELRSRFTTLEQTVKRLEDQLNPEDPRSWITSQQRQWEAVRNDLNRLGAAFEELRSHNQAEHQRLRSEAQQAVSQLTTDGQFLDHVREIIRFFKTA